MKRTHPAVFTVENKYIIIIPIEKPSLMWIEIGNEKYFDEANGVLRSNVYCHRITVPKDVLDKSESYTVVERIIIERSPYYPTSEDEIRTSYTFFPCIGENLRAFCISDTHSAPKEAIEAAKAYGKIDFLILGGDLADCNDDVTRYQATFDIASEVTKGEIPIVFARGNHDLRGAAAELQPQMMPNDNGNPYYTFKLGNIHGIVLDCGEDKPDEVTEYGNTVCFHGFRLKVTEFLKKVCESGDFTDNEHRIVICHIPFTYRRGNIFNIEEELYCEWSKLLKEYIKPVLIISGHLHRILSSHIGSIWDHRSQPCPLIIASEKGENYFCGCGLEFTPDSIKVCWYDCHGICPATAESPDFFFMPNDGRTVPENL